MLTQGKIFELEKKANDIRMSIIEMLVSAGSGHTAGPLGMADIFTYMFFHGLKHDAKDPMWSDRDRFVLSNGHICPVYYATMAHAGYFNVSELNTLRKFGSRLQGHPHREFMPWLETSSGPLGSGLSQACGMALVDKIDKKDNQRFIYCFLGDGELNEGNNWEAIMFAGKNKLNNLIAVVDRNNIQIDGNTEDIMPLESLAKKWESFNWHVIEISGHDFMAIDSAFMQAQSISEKPSVIIAHTIPGRGVKEFERDYRWHGVPPGSGPEDKIKKADQGRIALQELRTLGGKIKSEHQ